MANLDKQAQEVLKATMEHIEDTIRKLTVKMSTSPPGTLSSEEQETLDKCNEIRNKVWNLKQDYSPLGFYFNPESVRDEIGDLATKVNDYIEKNKKDIQTKFSQPGSTIDFPSSIAFNVSNLTPHDTKKDDSLALGFLMRSYCSDEQPLSAKKPLPSRMQQISDFMPGLPQPRPGGLKYVGAALACSAVSFVAPPVGVLLTAATVYAFSKDSNNQPQSRGTVYRETKSASVEHIKNTRVTLAQAIAQKSGVKPLSPAQKQVEKNTSSPTPSNPPTSSRN